MHTVKRLSTSASVCTIFRPAERGEPESDCRLENPAESGLTSCEEALSLVLHISDTIQNSLYTDGFVHVETQRMHSLPSTRKACLSHLLASMGCAERSMQMIIIIWAGSTLANTQ